MAIKIMQPIAAPPTNKWADLPAEVYIEQENHFQPMTKALYSQAHQMHGMTPGGVLIPPALHKLRIGRAVEMVKSMTASGSTVVDVGCGFGAFFDEAPPDRSYVGYEPDPGLAGECRKRHPSIIVIEQGIPLPKILESPADYAVCLGLATHLKPGLEALRWFAAHLQQFAGKGLIAEFQSPGKYKGQFTTHSILDIAAAFGQKPRPDNILQDQEDSTFTVYLRVA